jgi:hypothetical protein
MHAYMHVHKGGFTMENTYTYTARSADDPTRVVTFTLYNDQLAVGVGVPMEQVERSVRASLAEARDEAEGEGGAVIETATATEGEGGEEAGVWAKPLAVSLVERATRPISISDVDARLRDGDLRLTAWVRTGGLRLAPLTFRVDRVDNADAAEAFVSELERRKRAASAPGIFAGPLDYWATWLLGSALALTLLIVGLRKHDGDTEAA